MISQLLLIDKNNETEGKGKHTSLHLDPIVIMRLLYHVGVAIRVDPIVEIALLLTVTCITSVTTVIVCFLCKNVRIQKQSC